MEIDARNKKIILDFDEIEFLARQTESWDRNTLKDAKISMAKAAKKFISTLRSDPTTRGSIAYNERFEV